MLRLEIATGIRSVISEWHQLMWTLKGRTPAFSEENTVSRSIHWFLYIPKNWFIFFLFSINLSYKDTILTRYMHLSSHIRSRIIAVPTKWNLLNFACSAIEAQATETTFNSPDAVSREEPLTVASAMTRGLWAIDTKPRRWSTPFFGIKRRSSSSRLTTPKGSCPWSAIAPPTVLMVDFPCPILWQCWKSFLVSAAVQVPFGSELKERKYQLRNILW
jgi:hypothetical protein